MSTQPVGSHFVGSLTVNTPEEAFITACSLLPNRVTCIPDGECGERKIFVHFQRAKIPQEYVLGYGSDGREGHANQSPEEIYEALKNYKTDYDTHAIESYAIFEKLKNDGKIPKNVRFQVSIPTEIDITFHMKPFCRPIFHDIAAKALQEAVTDILAAIPADDLAFQIDSGVGFALLEKEITSPVMKPMTMAWMEDVRGTMLKSIAALANHIGPDVPLGFHLCYGDLGGVHFVEPTDMGKLVDAALGIQDVVSRPIDWFHMPVPKDRADDAYFAPLGELVPRLGKTKLYLGLVHENDEDGTRERIAVAQKVAPEFGVAAECGFGRSSPERMADICRIACTVSAELPKG